MPVEFSYPHCDKTLRIKTSLAGMKARCTCGEIVRVPDVPQRLDPETNTFIHRCKDCGVRHQVPAKMAGTHVECECGTTLFLPIPRGMPGGPVIVPGGAAAPGSGVQGSAAPGSGVQGSAGIDDELLPIDPQMLTPFAPPGQQMPVNGQGIGASTPTGGTSAGTSQAVPGGKQLQINSDNIHPFEDEGEAYGYALGLATKGWKLGRIRRALMTRGLSEDSAEYVARSVIPDDTLERHDNRNRGWGLMCSGMIFLVISVLIAVGTGAGPFAILPVGMFVTGMFQLMTGIVMAATGIR